MIALATYNSEYGCPKKKQLLTSYKSVVMAMCLLLFCIVARSQDTVQLNTVLEQRVFTNKQIEYLVDTNSTLSLQQIQSTPFARQFKPPTSATPRTYNTAYSYWCRINIKLDNTVNRKYVLELFDQTIDDITAYLPNRNNGYDTYHLGDSKTFFERPIQHKNFVMDMSNFDTSTHTYYFKIKSSQLTNLIIVLRNKNWFIGYATKEYFFFGIFYGMILIFCFYNLILFFAIRQRHYLYYVLYISSVGLYEMSSDGIAYQYLWPLFNNWNQIAFGVMLFFTSIFSLLFTDSLLKLRKRASTLHQAVKITLLVRTLFFIFCLFFNRDFFNYKFIDFIPIIICFFIGIKRLRNGYEPARFFVLGYSFLIVGILAKFIALTGISWLNQSMFTYYVISFCFVLEMCCLGFALGDRLRFLKKAKEKAQEETIRQMLINTNLQNNLNKELEIKVQERTSEVQRQALIISQQNKDLQEANEQLRIQSEEISKINVVLEADNTTLKTNVTKISKARVLSSDLTFEEFSQSYPDEDSCFKLLADLKWSNGFTCKRCGSTDSRPGKTPYSHRCAKCRYEESATTGTLFENTRIPMNKAFYMTSLLYATKGKISSHKLSRLLEIRQATCYAISVKVKAALEEKKKELKHDSADGWTILVLDEEPHAKQTTTPRNRAKQVAEEMSDR